jgi:hypothetical protein
MSFFGRILRSVAILFLVSSLAPGAFAQCRQVGGALITNFGGVDANTTLGPASGDLSGAVAASILGVAPGANGTTVFTVQHHWVTDAGHAIFFKVAEATVAPVAPGVFGVVSYTAVITGGTGKFAGATGTLRFTGEADLNAGTIALRYNGRVCLAAQ